MTNKQTKISGSYEISPVTQKGEMDINSFLQDSKVRIIKRLNILFSNLLIFSFEKNNIVVTIV